MDFIFSIVVWISVPVDGGNKSFRGLTGLMVSEREARNHWATYPPCLSNSSSDDLSIMAMHVASFANIARSMAAVDKGFDRNATAMWWGTGKQLGILMVRIIS